MVPSTPSLSEEPFCQAPPSPGMGAGNAGGGIRICGSQDCRRDIPVVRAIRCGRADRQARGVASRRMVPLEVAVFPALSVAEAVRFTHHPWKR